jgi:hypothetical protein
MSLRPGDMGQWPEAEARGACGQSTGCPQGSASSHNFPGHPRGAILPAEVHHTAGGVVMRGMCPLTSLLERAGAFGRSRARPFSRGCADG